MIVELVQARKSAEIGEKARNLRWLAVHGYRIPRSHILPYAVYAQYRQDPEAAARLLAAVLPAILEHGRPVAVRSSANLEDTQRLSFAGQFRTFLNVHGVEQVIQAVLDIWQAAQSESVQAYAHKSGQALHALKLAVIIQEMVNPLVSGVAFSKNPLTGLNELVVEALPGSGEQLVQEGKTPQRWVYRWGEWITRPAQATLPETLLQQVVTGSAEIARRYGTAVDLEWVYDGQELFWVQLRPITGLDRIPIYSNRISREVFPGLIRPLVWSVNVPLVNTVWINLFSEMVGANQLRPHDLARSFGFRAYFNMGTIGRIFEQMGFPRESLEILLGLPGGKEKPRFKPSAKTMGLLPRLLWFGLDKLRVGPEVLPALAQARQAYAHIQQAPPASLDEAGLLAQVERLYAQTQRVAHFNVVVPLLMSIYNALLRRQLKCLGVDETRFDPAQGLAELQDYDPTLHIQRAARSFIALDAALQARIAASAWDDLPSLPGAQEFYRLVCEILDRFGHLCDSGNDFSSTPWRETPALVVGMVLAEAQRLSAPAAGQPAHVRTHFDLPQPGTSPGSKLTWESLRLPALSRWLLHPLYLRARRFRLYREAVSSVYTYGYGLFRPYFLELGKRLAGRGLLAHAQDIFYLDWEEIRQAVSGALAAPDSLARTASRKSELEVSQGLALPETIYGDTLPPFEKLPQDGQTTYTGIPSSRGYYRGPVKVIRSVADFGKLEQGDVLVIPFSDVSWTPLFTRAGAVIAESGGILSHSSIVAREFNLPCVVSVSQACQFPDQAIVSVDGFKGEVILHSAP